MLRKFLGRLRRDKKGQGLVEYALIIGGVALIAAASISVFGHKTTDIISAVAVILPGAHTDDNNAIQSGHLIETAPSGTSGAIAVDVTTIPASKNTDRLGLNVLGTQVLRTASMVSSLSLRDRSRKGLTAIWRLSSPDGSQGSDGPRSFRWNGWPYSVCDAWILPMIWWVLLLFVLPATVIDLKTREVPDLLSLTLLGWAIVVTGLHLHDVGWASLLGGFLIGIGFSGAFYAMGGIGGGDVKFIAALGAALGHAAIIPALFWIALSGGALALLALYRGKRDLAYLPAIAIGLAIDQLCHGRFIHV